MTNASEHSARGFFRLAICTALLTIGLIIFGAVVRVTDSGLGCGEDWPFCNGTIFPPLDNLTAWIEWTHRLFALLIGLLGLGMLYMAWRRYLRQNRGVFIVTVSAAALFLMQSILGALTVKLGLSPTMVTLHLGTAMLLLGALLAAGMISVYRPQIQRPADNVTMLVYINTVLSLIIILTGALVRGSGATLACQEWPLCFGQVLPVQAGQLAIIHMLHRFAVVALGITLVILVWQVRRVRQTSLPNRLAWSALLAYAVQALVGAAFIFTSAAPVWGATHVGLAATTWALLVALSVIEWLDSREMVQENEWTPQSDSLTG